MGYKINRVPLDFSWPLNKVWCGYVNPHLSHLKECSCDNGYSQYGTHLNNLWYGYSEFKPEDNGSVPFSPEDECIVAFATRNVTRAPEYYGTATQENIHEECVRLANLFNGQWACHLNQDDVNALIEADRLYTFTHRPINPITEDDIKNHAYYLWLNAGCPENSDVYFWELSKEQHSRHYLPYNNGYIPTATEVNRWNIMSMGHDSINASVVILARAKREGKSAICEICQGAGSFWTSTEHENLYNNFVNQEFLFLTSKPEGIFKFNENGKVSGNLHENESLWLVKDNKFYFLNMRGVETGSFDVVDGKLINGKSLINGVPLFLRRVI